MKKISLLLAVAGVAMGFVSCDNDREPVLQTPTEFVLNVPAMQDQYIELTQGNTLELIASQPDYGYSAVAQYSAQVSLTPDFAKYADLEAIDPTQSRINVKQEAVAGEICNLLGIEGEESFLEKYPDGQMPYMKIYFRAVCQLEGVEGTAIASNVVSYNHLKAYLAVQSAGYIYLVGNPEGWAGPVEENAAHYAEWRLFEPENAIGSKIYIGEFDLPSAPMFRFYTKLTGWDADSYGCQVEDNPLNFELVDGSITETLISGKGSFNFPNFEGGKVTIVVDMSNPDAMTFSMSTGDIAPSLPPMYIYAIGNQFGNWTAPGVANEATLEPYRLTSTDGGHIYTATLPVTAGDLYMRFALELAEMDNDSGWGGPQIGIQEDDNAIACEFTNGTFEGPFVSGKGSWYFVLPADGNISLTVDMDNQTVSYSFE